MGFAICSRETNSGLSERQVARQVADRHRMQQRDKHQLLPMARKFLERAFAAKCTAAQADQRRLPLPSGALEILAEGDQSNSTANAYAPYVDKWSRWCAAKEIIDFPPDPWNFSIYLLEAASNDKTVAPTTNRRNAMAWACARMGMTSVTQDDFVVSAVRGLHVRLGARKLQKEPFLPEYVRSIFERHAAACDAELTTLLNVMRIATMVEAGLRWDDLSSVSFGSLCRFEGAVRIFCAQTKTDSRREGQWATLVASEAPEAAVQLIRRVQDRLKASWAEFPVAIRRELLGANSLVDPASDEAFLEEVSMACLLQHVKGDRGAVLFPRLGFRQLASSGDFSKVLKGWAAELGLDPNAFASHSGKIGCIHGAHAAGVPDRLIRQMGRWRSENMVAHYLGEARTTRELVAHLSKKWQRSEDPLRR